MDRWTLDRIEGRWSRRGREKWVTVRPENDFMIKNEVSVK